MSDMFTRTAVWSPDPMEGNTMQDQYLDPQDTNDYWDHYLAVVEHESWTDPTEVDMDSWDDLTGIDVDGHGSEDAMELVENVAWLHSLAYSDYADPSDDDDRDGMNIPRAILDGLA